MRKLSIKKTFLARIFHNDRDEEIGEGIWMLVTDSIPS